VAANFGEDVWRPGKRVSHRGEHWAMSYGGRWAVTRTCNDVVNGLRQGTTMGNGAYSGDGRLATSPAQVGTATRRNNGPSLSSTRYFLPQAVICTKLSKNRNSGDDHGMELTGDRFSISEDLYLLYHHVLIQSA
jgi:hypothetical protein